MYGFKPTINNEKKIVHEVIRNNTCYFWSVTLAVAKMCSLPMHVSRGKETVLLRQTSITLKQPLSTFRQLK